MKYYICIEIIRQVPLVANPVPLFTLSLVKLKAMISILIADDHAVVRYGTSRILKEMLPDAKVTEAENFPRLLSLLDGGIFRLLILDINIPGGNNLQMIDVVRLRQPQIKLLVFSGYDEQVYALRCLQAGADGYLMKDSGEEEIKTAVSAVLKNERYSSTAIKQHLLNSLIDRKPVKDNPLQALTDRETEVLHQLIKGLNTASIARLLNLQTSTISTYKTRIFEKMSVSNVVELAEKVRVYNNTSSKQE